MERNEVCQIKDLPSNSSEDVVRVVLRRVRCQFCDAEDVLRWADEVTQDSDDEDGATTEEPDE